MLFSGLRADGRSSQVDSFPRSLCRKPRGQHTRVCSGYDPNSRVQTCACGDTRGYHSFELRGNKRISIKEIGTEITARLQRRPCSVEQCVRPGKLPPGCVPAGGATNVVDPDLTDTQGLSCTNTQRTIQDHTGGLS